MNVKTALMHHERGTFSPQNGNEDMIMIKGDRNASIVHLSQYGTCTLKRSDGICVSVTQELCQQEQCTL